MDWHTLHSTYLATFSLVHSTCRAPLTTFSLVHSTCLALLTAFSLIHSTCWALLAAFSLVHSTCLALLSPRCFSLILILYMARPFLVLKHTRDTGELRFHSVCMGLNTFRVLCIYKCHSFFLDPLWTGLGS